MGTGLFFWGACGEDYRQFLISLDIYYTAGKFGESGWFDLDGTLAGYREDILQARRNDELESDEARELWEAIEEMFTERFNHYPGLLESEIIKKLSQ